MPDLVARECRVQPLSQELAVNGGVRAEAPHSLAASRASAHLAAPMGHNPCVGMSVGTRERGEAVLWLLGYVLFLALMLWMSARNPSSPLGQPADPTGRIGIFSVLVLPLALWLGTVQAGLDHDAVAQRVTVVVILAVVAAVAASMIGLLPDDLRSCLALRRLPEIPERCLTTADLRRTVVVEATLVWLAFGASWVAAAKRRTRRDRGRLRRASSDASHRPGPRDAPGHGAGSRPQP